MSIDAAESAKTLGSLGGFWPFFVGYINTGRMIREDDDVIVWCPDPKRYSVKTVFFEYRNIEESVENVIINSNDADFVVWLFQMTLCSLKEAFAANIIHEKPLSRNLYCDGSRKEYLWGALSSLRRKRDGEKESETILLVVADYYAIAARMINKNVSIHLRNYLDDRLCTWGINKTLCNKLATAKKETIDVFRGLRLWKLDLHFSTACETFDVYNQSIDDNTYEISFLDTPKASDGFIFYSMSLKTKAEIGDDWNIYDDYFVKMFSNTKKEIKKLFEDAKLVCSYIEESLNDVNNLLIYSKELTADWLTIRVLIDALSTRAEYRKNLVTDTVSANVFNYSSEIKSKLLRVTGEWQDRFTSMEQFLDIDAMEELHYRWETIRDFSRKLR
jgi:hypothetical protein